MDRAQLRKRIRGTLVTAPTAFDADMKLDLARMTDMTRWWMEQGLGTDVAPLKTSAAMGEGPDLSDDEWPHLLRTVVNAAGSDATIMCALKPKDTLSTIEDAKRAQDLGAIALQIDLPFFHHSNQDDHVRHFTAISDAIDIGIMIYNTYWFCSDPVKEYLHADTMLRLKDAEHVIAIKWAVPEGEDYDDMRKFSDSFNVIDNSFRSLSVRGHKNGGAGYISPFVAVYPSHDLEVFQLMERKCYDEAQAKIDAVQAELGPWMAKTTARSGGYRQGKGLLAALGRSMGEPRPPTLPCDEAEIAEARTLLERLGWAQEAHAVAAD